MFDPKTHRTDGRSEARKNHIVKKVQVHDTLLAWREHCYASSFFCKRGQFF